MYQYILSQNWHPPTANNASLALSHLCGRIGGTMNTAAAVAAAAANANCSGKGKKEATIKSKKMAAKRMAEVR
jgi:hypothetical protein